MKTKLIAITILALLAATPLTYARGGPGFGGGAHFGGFHGGGRSFYGGNRGFYGGGNRFYGGGNRFYGGSHQYYGGSRGYYGRHADWSRYHQRHHRGRYYYGYSNDWWPWGYGYYDGDSYPYDSYVYYDDSGDGYYRRNHRTYHGRADQAGRYRETRKVYHRQ